jgi:hypothetical protein
MRTAIIALATIICSLPAAARSVPADQGLSVLVDGSPRREYHHRGTNYIEALRGAEYTLRLTNPHPFRVAVALSVDGLNTIDAKHTSAWNASKWVLAPYETVDIEGWQVSDATARRFFFTGERDSYGAAIGKTANLGVIEAVFFRERERRVLYERKDYGTEDAAAGQAAPSAPATAEARRERDDYAATGMGGRTSHEVERVNIDLEREPIMSVRLRYEFRPQLVKLGVLPEREHRTPLDRRERARGFDEYCPEPNRR